MPPAPSASGAGSCWCGGCPTDVVARFTVPHAGDLRLLRCPACGTARLLPPPDDAVLAAAYARDYYGDAARKFRGPVDAAFARTQARRARAAAALVPPGGHVLDVGCGAGEFVRALRARGLDAEGTERTAEAAARAAAASGVPVHAGDVETLDLGSRRYDLVSIWHVLEHLRDPLAALRRAHGLLRPGGALLVAVPNAGSWQARVFGGHWFHHDPPRHLWAFDAPALQALLRRAGFVPGPVRTFSLEQNPYGVLQSALNALGFPRDRAYDLLKGVPRGGRALDATLVGLLAVPALAFALVEAAAGRGGTLALVARRGQAPAAGGAGR